MNRLFRGPERQCYSVSIEEESRVRYLYWFVGGYFYKVGPCLYMINFQTGFMIMSYI